ncbi:hypothetical protein AB0C34_17070 [Nocardia sp. NPDC049220]|uniref:hypothetical protein n=1 Tax=Nocardia sp. NPDC049220 TaxID=3155273 RepID=UPI0033D127D6
MSSSDDRSCPHTGEGPIRDSPTTTASSWENPPGSTDNIDTIVDRLNTDQVGGSWSLPLADGASAKVPAWDSSQQWLQRLQQVLDTDHGRVLLKRQHTCARTVVKIAKVMAAGAETRTGRRLTASIATLAARSGFSDSTVERARAVVLKLGFAVDMATGRHLYTHERAAARAHHGGYQAVAASVWHLTIPRATAPADKPLAPRRKSASLGRVTRRAHRAAAPAAVAPAATSVLVDRGREDLSSPTGVGEERFVGTGSSFVLNSSFVGKKSPTRARSAHARTRNSRKTSEKPWKDADPRPLHLQLAAAEVVTHCHGLDRGQWLNLGSQRYLRRPGWHIGAVADALVEAGIDTTRYDGKMIAARLTRYTIERGVHWPNRINAPIAFLRHLLAGVDWTQQVPTEPAAERRARRRTHTCDLAPVQCLTHPWSGRRSGGECSGCFSDRIVTDPAPSASTVDDASTRTDRGWEALAHRAVRVAPVRSPGVGNRPIASAVVRSIETQLSVCDELATAATDVCVVCAAPGSMRDELPLPMPTCDQCWETSQTACV